MPVADKLIVDAFCERVPVSSIRVTQLSKQYGTFHALKNVSMDVKPGSLSAVLGPSGSGKTTMLSAVAGIILPSSGSIEIAGRDVTLAPAAKRNVGLVFQSYALFPHLSVFENVAFPLRVRGRPSEEVKSLVGKALERVRLGGMALRKPSQLSGGQQQRVAIARAIVFEPSVLLLDEPLAALDRKLREEVRMELRELQRELGITTLLVTHDQDEALSMADEVIIMAEGRIQQVDTPEEAYRRPSNEFVANFLGIANIFRGEIKGSEQPYIQLPEGDQIRLEVGMAGNASSNVFGMLRPEQLKIVSAETPGALPVDVSERIFLGESVRYLLKTRRGYVFTAQNSNFKRDIAIGDRVGLTWQPEDVWVLPT